MTLQLTRRRRQAVLVAHIVCAVGWIGVNLALLPLTVTGLTTDSTTATVSIIPDTTGG